MTGSNHNAHSHNTKPGVHHYRSAETGADVTQQNVQAMRQLEEAAMARRTGSFTLRSGSAISDAFSTTSA